MSSPRCIIYLKFSLSKLRTVPYSYFKEWGLVGSLFIISSSISCSDSFELAQEEDRYSEQLIKRSTRASRRPSINYRMAPTGPSAPSMPEAEPVTFGSSPELEEPQPKTKEILNHTSKIQTDQESSIEATKGFKINSSIQALANLELEEADELFEGNLRADKDVQNASNLRVPSDSNIERALKSLISSSDEVRTDSKSEISPRDLKPYDEFRDSFKNTSDLLIGSGLSIHRLANDGPDQRIMKKKLAKVRENKEKLKSSIKQDESKQPSFIKEYLSLGKPDRFWPRQGYFKNTYLGGDLAYQEKLRRASHRLKDLMSIKGGFAWSPPLDPPLESGMTLSAKLSHSHLDHPQRVIMQVALKGSNQYGWRRPALNLMIVVDPNLLDGSSEAEARQSMLVDIIKPILKRLNVADQVGLSYGKTLLTPRRPEQLKEALIQSLESIMQSSNTAQDWRNLLQESGKALNKASADPYRAPGAQAILMLCAKGCVRNHFYIENAVHRLNLDGTLTSVIDHSKPNRHARDRQRDNSLWTIATAGHGGFWVSTRSLDLEKAINKEFDRFSRVVARLLRLSIKLGEQVELIEVLGSEMLNKEQKAQVKAREKAMDQRLSTRLGIKSDRGEDDEGVQVVIPAFYGGDSHLIHLALWVNKPGEIAEIQLKYKDMVQAKNASYAEQILISAMPRDLTLAHHEVLEGANHHLLAAKTLEAVRLKKNFDHLPSLQDHIQSSLEQLNSFEIELMSRAKLGRPQAH